MIRKERFVGGAAKRNLRRNFEFFLRSFHRFEIHRIATAMTVTAVAIQERRVQIDLVASKTASFFEVKRASRRYSAAALERKRDAFLRATGKFRGWRLSCDLLGLP